MGEVTVTTPRRAWLVDGAVALLLTAVAVVEVLSWHGVIDGLLADPTATRGWLPFDLTLAVVCILPLAGRRALPTLVPAAVFAMQIVANLAVAHHFPFFGGLISLGLLAYTFGGHAPPHLARWGWVGPVLWAATFPIHTRSARDVASVVYAVVLLTLPWVVGRVIRRLHDQRQALDDALSELSRLEQTRREAALLHERARIAREMHDVLAHGVSVMVVQTGAARLDVATDSPAHGHLLNVEQTGRRVLGELRRTVGLLRSGAPDDEVMPAPGLGDLPDVVESMQRAGLTIRLSLGDVGRADPPRELVAYRVVQEALTRIACVMPGEPP